MVLETIHARAVRRAAVEVGHFDARGTVEADALDTVPVRGGGRGGLVVTVSTAVVTVGTAWDRRRTVLDCQWCAGPS